MIAKTGRIRKHPIIGTPQNSEIHFPTEFVRNYGEFAYSLADRGTVLVAEAEFGVLNRLQETDDAPVLMDFVAGWVHNGLRGRGAAQQHWFMPRTC